MSKSKNGFFQRIFGGEPIAPPSHPLEERLLSLERQLRSSVQEWDDALDRLQRLAGRASKLQGLREQAQQSPQLSRAEQLNMEINAERAARPPFLNGGHK